MRAVLEGREKAALVRVEELRVELERVTSALSEAEELLQRRVIGLEQYLEALAEQETPAVVAPGGSAEVEEPAPGAERAPRRAVARKESGVSVEALGLDYRRIMEAFGSPDGTGLTARQVAVQLGWDTAVASRVEGARGRMKRLVERGWLCEERPGLFTLPSASGPGPAAAAG
jgi:hypothetical protein